MAEQIKFLVHLGKAWVTVTQTLEDVGDALGGYRVRDGRLNRDFPSFSLELS